MSVSFVRKQKKKIIIPSGYVAKIAHIDWRIFVIMSTLLICLFFLNDSVSFYVTSWLRSNIFLSKPDISTIENSVAFLISLNLLLALLVFFHNLTLKKIQPQLNINLLLSLNWEDLESLTEILFKKSGYKTVGAGGARADGGVDLYVYKNRRKSIVQCKHYKTNNVGVSIIREMFGVMVHEKAKSVYIITCGKFTKDAIDFAKGKPIILINGVQFVELYNKGKIK